MSKEIKRKVISGELTINLKDQDLFLENEIDDNGDYFGIMISTKNDFDATTIANKINTDKSIEILDARSASTNTYHPIRTVKYDEKSITIYFELNIEYRYIK